MVLKNQLKLCKDGEKLTQDVLQGKGIVLAEMTIYWPKRVSLAPFVRP